MCARLDLPELISCFSLLHWRRFPEYASGWRAGNGREKERPLVFLYQTLLIARPLFWSSPLSEGLEYGLILLATAGEKLKETRNVRRQTAWGGQCKMSPSESSEFFMGLSCYWLSPREPTATLAILWQNSWSVTGQTNEKLTSVCN